MTRNHCSRILAMLAAVAALPAMAAPCIKEAQRNVQLDTSGITKIEVTAGAGDLRVRGEKGRNQLSVTGQACASSQELLDKIQLEQRREGSTLIVKAVFPETEGFLGYARMDMTVTLPDSVDLNLTDSSGDAEIEGVQALVFNDSSGDADIRKVRGSLNLTDSSGDLDIEEIGGGVTLTDSSGDIEIEKVAGKVKIDIDSSGGIRIDRAGAVHILTDSSGDISIENVQADVLIDTDSSGDIEVANVGGKFTVGADGSGSIRERNVAGAVSLPR
jgi:DUF4097 and DUF4098 domain-containing protein YvlB